MCLAIFLISVKKSNMIRLHFFFGVHISDEVIILLLEIPDTQNFVLMVKNSV